MFHDKQILLNYLHRHSVLIVSCYFFLSGLNENLLVIVFLLYILWSVVTSYFYVGDGWGEKNRKKKNNLF